ncbi:trifunctional serine/threonine-protein kinase/ATP-binding protein/sensor histidine kinase [Pseudomonas kribbensis]|uniref:trifunctional serine/threonine-protein kinase/ATP-binding protein/sensor histidine kinase n=1 Tax=Pseudomonas kribbensis TaxID=1628086 RepID=UPI001F38CC7B|nr:AAA family ATPase [Pseudomonas kribbensis]UIN57565.1 AAA family ATPase [Pseudomonas kribbensis]
MQMLWDDAERILLRGRRASGGHEVDVLIASLATEQPSGASVERLAHEFSLKDQLESDWAARPLELLHDEGRLQLVLEDPGGVPLARLLTAPLDVATFLPLAISVAVALGKLHRRGLIHKDIKPAHLLVNCPDGHARLTGFGLASRLPRERQPAEPPETLSGTLAYMAPEQTGRMNRLVDSRSDLYAFGVTLYQMLTGSLPFSAADPMEWLHCHIARTPMSPSARVATVPEMLSRIVMKLLAKTAEERYQSALGVEQDLRRCLAGWHLQNMDEFALDEQGTCDRLLIPEKLYGREPEVQTLIAAFERIAVSHRPELVLVCGYSGIGKSSVVHELHQTLVPVRGLFASGKFDQYKRDVPYSTLAQAFQGLVRTLLGQSDSQMAEWRNALRQALGAEARLVSDLIPELKLIIGDTPPVADLEPPQAQRRFLQVLRRFIGVFARAEHPLVLFLDDLQWLDVATLNWLEELLTHSHLQHLMLIGAYRSNEVDASHPLTTRLSAIKAAGGRVHEITLLPLARSHIEQLIAESSRSEPSYIAPLAQLILDKTQGNPFFVIQFLQTLVEQDLLTFDHDRRQWVWDAQRIHTRGYTDNVVDLMLDKMARLPAETQQALQQLACLGNLADVASLSTVLDLPVAQVHGVLWPAVRHELITRQDSTYGFVHDRVQEAAYLLIDEAARAQHHLRIGRSLVEKTPADKHAEKIFEMVGQLNRGAALMNRQQEREHLSQLNLLAGERARASTAYASALTYFAQGAALLGEGGWEHQRELMFALESGRAFCEFLTRQLGSAEARLRQLSRRALTLIERTRVACLQADLYLVLNQSDNAVTVCLAFLRYLGIEWSPHPDDDEVRDEYRQIGQRLGERPIEALIDLPPMVDETALATLEALTKLIVAAVHMDGNLPGLAMCRAINLSIEYGNSDASCVAYANVSRIAGRRFADYPAGVAFAELGCRLVERRDLERYQARTQLAFWLFAKRWAQPIRTCLEPLARIFEVANRTGDLPIAAFTGNSRVSNLLATGEPLAELHEEAERGLAYARKIGFGVVIDFIETQLAFIRMLRGQTPTFGSIGPGAFAERHCEDHQTSLVAICWHWIRTLQACYFAGHYEAAAEAGAAARQLLRSSHSFLEEAEYCFYQALTLAALCSTRPAGERQAQLDVITAQHRQLQVWAELCPDNFASHAALLAGEIARLEGRLPEAEHCFEHAIESAQRSGFLHIEALANELAARFYESRGLHKIARVYLQDARYGYQRWGAEGKVRQLEAEHTFLRVEKPLPGPTSTIATPVEHLDLATVLKVSQAASSEIVLEKLIDMIMRTAIEQAGAQRGVLILTEQGEQRIVAEAITRDDATQLDLRDAPVAARLLPESVLNQVLRTQENLVLADALAEPSFAADPYVRQHRVRSVLCLPLLNQAKLIGVLYLENNLTSRVFSPSRIASLRLIASQAAISLVNARLYRDVAEREVKSRESEQRYREIQAELAHACRVATMGQLAASIAHEVSQPLASTLASAQAALRWSGAAPPNLEETRLCLERIVRDAHRGSEVLDRIRGLIRKAPQPKEPVNLNEVIGEVIEITRSQAQKAGVSVEAQMAASLPRVDGDRVELQQVVLNLVMNALEAMSGAGVVKGELRIRTQANEAEQVWVCVSDSGPGFGAHSIGQLFTPFYTTKPTGLGMGLSICRSIIETHGGQLWIEANQPCGAVVQFVLPADPVLLP